MPFVIALARTLALIFLGIAFVAVPMAGFKLGLQPWLDAALPGDMIPPAVAHPVGMLLAMTLGYWTYVRFVERRPAIELTPRPMQAWIGVASALILIGTPMLVLYVAGFYRVQSYSGIAAIWNIAPTILAAAVLEELVFRGLIFSILERRFGLISALLSQTLLFGVVHMSNAGFTKPIDLLAVILIGGWWTLLYVMWRNIWTISLHHAVWNLTIAASGLPLSGIEDFRKGAPFHSVFDGARLLSGGDAGPEASILTLSLVCVTAVIVTWLAWRRGSLRAAAPI